MIVSFCRWFMPMVWRCIGVTFGGKLTEGTSIIPTFWSGGHCMAMFLNCLSSDVGLLSRTFPVKCIVTITIHYCFNFISMYDVPQSSIQSGPFLVMYITPLGFSHFISRLKVSPSEFLDSFWLIVGRVNWQLKCVGTRLQEHKRSFLVHR